jgi:hypothetical protein
MENFDPQAHSQAQANLQHAEAQAAALLAELEAKDAANSVASTVQPHRMPSQYAPGESPDPVAGVAASSGFDQFTDALDGSFKPVDFSKIRQTTLASSHTADLSQKLRTALRPNGSH